MRCQFEIMKQSLQFVKQADISRADKMLIETRMISLLVMLLDKDLPDEVIRGASGEDGFGGLLTLVKALGNAEGDNDAVDDVIYRIRSITAALSNRQPQLITAACGEG